MVLYRIMLCFLPDHQAKALVRLSKTGWGYRFYLCIVLYANLYSVSPIGLSQGFRDGPSSLALSCQPVFVVLCVWGGGALSCHHVREMSRRLLSLRGKIRWSLWRGAVPLRPVYPSNTFCGVMSLRVFHGGESLWD